MANAQISIRLATSSAAARMKVPLIESLNARGVAVNIEIVPFQSLFQPAVAGDERSRNVVVIKPEDWLHRQANAEISFREGERTLAELPRYKLPNGMEIAHQNKSETDFLFDEIFQDNVYLKHGITLPEGACIFDVGANIGLFSIFAHQNCRGAHVCSFEPLPPVFELLKANTVHHGVNVSLFNCGLSNESKEAVMTYYPNYSIMSGFHADVKQEKEVLEVALGNLLNQNPKLAQHGALNKYMDGLLTKRLEHKTITAQLKTLSSIISEQNIKRIDLLKIDVERSELNVLRGIDADHWKLIRQIAMEVHDGKGDVVDEISRLLQEKGFTLAVDVDKSLANAGVYMLYAIRSDGHEEGTFDLTAERENVSRRVDQLLTDLDSSAQAAPFLIAIEPSESSNPERAGMLREMENRLVSGLNSKGVKLVRLPRPLDKVSLDGGALDMLSVEISKL